MSESAMTEAAAEESGHWCILLPCSSEERWAVPQNALAEIVTLHTESELPPESLDWRGEVVPVLDFGHGEEPPWRERVGSAGLVAVFLGVEGEHCRYWGLALRGQGLAVKNLLPGEVQDAPEQVAEHATAAFSLAGEIYQVPDLIALQRRISTDPDRVK